MKLAMTAITLVVRIIILISCTCCGAAGWYLKRVVENARHETTSAICAYPVGFDVGVLYRNA